MRHIYTSPPYTHTHVHTHTLVIYIRIGGIFSTKFTIYYLQYNTKLQEKIHFIPVEVYNMNSFVEMLCINLPMWILFCSSSILVKIYFILWVLL